MVLKTKINGFEVEYNNDIIRIDGYHCDYEELDNLIYAKYLYEEYFETELNQIVLKRNYFGMLIKYEDLEKLYNEITEL